MSRTQPPAAVLLAAACFLSFLPSISAAPLGPERSYHLDNEFWTHLARDAGGVLASPLSWKPLEILGGVAVLGAAGLTYAHDQDIQDWAQTSRTPASDAVMRVMEKGGDAAYLTGLLAGIYLAGEVGPSRGLRKTAVLGLESLAVSGAVVLSMKCLFGRARPELALPSNHFEPFTFQASYMSLPSGHAASAFAVATSIACQVDSLVADVLLYGLAGVVAVSRVHDNKHWASDVLLGAVLGHVIAVKIADLNRSGERALSLAPVLAPAASGFSLRF